MSRILLSAGEILTMREATEPTPRRGWVGVEGNRIKMVSYDEGDAEAFRSGGECREIDCSGMVVMPGLVNTHTHIPMTLMRNYADDMELMEWLTGYIWKFESKLSESDIESGTRVGVAELLLGGCTSFVDMYWSEYAIARVVREMGIRAKLTESILDGRSELFVRDMDRLREEAAGCSRISCGVSPHAPYTCSAATLEIARSYAERHNISLTIHLSETQSEIDTIRERYDQTPLEYLEKAGVVGEGTILAHCVYIEPEEMDRIAQSGAAVAHNAQSNLKLASGIAPIAQMSAKGVLCTLATDGASSNNDLDMWEEMRTAALLQRVKEMDATVMPAYELLRMATIYGAQAMGYDDLGTVEEGALADLIVVDTRGVHHRPRHNRVSTLVYCGKSSDVRHVIVDGELRVDGGKLVGVDIESICRDAEERCDRIAIALREESNSTIIEL
ncbi:MAG: amidohydrolase [Rikenellaceae bacterium]